jgi:GNAT superfamily N-acetyltransferase
MSTEVEVRPIRGDDVSEIATFFHRHLNHAVTPSAWARLLEPPWRTESEEHGYQLRVNGELVGAYAAVFSRRLSRGTPQTFCNLAGFSVRDEYRAQGLLLLRAALKRRDLQYTDLSPSGNVVELNRRMGFTPLDTRTRLVVNVPRLPARRWKVSSRESDILDALHENDTRIYLDHRNAPAAEHLVVRSGDRYSYLVFRADRRKGMQLFASPLYVGGDRDLLAEAWGSVRSHILRTRRLPFFLAEERILGFRKGLGRELQNPRPKMIRGDGIDPSTVDYLYSELTLVSW